MSKLKILISIVIVSIFAVGFALAGSDDNVWGWAWSENIGWVSFNSTNTAGAVDYGVNIDSDGHFSGTAWSENIGWFSFNQADTGAPPAAPDYGTYLAKVDLGTGEVSGWARALSFGDGWSGWLKLRGPNYGVSIDGDTGEFSGWAWSDMVIGWLSFNNLTGGGTTEYKVRTSFVFPPSVSNATTTWIPCSDSLHPSLDWDYSGGTPDGYYVQIYSDAGLTNLIYEYTAVGTLSTAHIADYDSGNCHLAEGENGFKNSPICNLEYGGKNYFWRVKAKKQAATEVWSDWSNVDSFTTYLHSWPKPDFKCSASSTGPWIDCSNTKLAANEVIYFHDETSFSNGGTSWNWSFGDGSTSPLQHPSHSYSNPGKYTVILESTDSAGYFCPTDHTDLKFRITVQIPLPEWKEIPPFIWLKNFLVSIFEFFQSYLTV